MCLTIDELRGLCTPDNIYLTLHASKRLEQRGILIDDVISCIMTGEIIEEYPNDYPYPSCLTLGNLNTKCPLHVVVGSNHEQLGNELRPGMSTYEIDRIGEEMIRSFGCEPSFKNYCGYPASVCVSIDEEVVHGIPSKEKFIQEGDIVSLDIGVIHKGYHSDAARTHAVGEISKEAALLIERTRQSFFEGMKYAAAGRHLYEISGAIGSYAESFGYGVVRDLCGHGIGTHLHEEPDIPNFKKFRRGIKLKSGMTLAVEPMINIGTPDVLWLDDEWTVITADMSLSAHYENTIIITEGRPEILTLTDSEIAAHIWE